MLSAALVAACRRPAPALPEVRVFASADLPAEVVRDAAARFGVARVTLAAAPEGAEVAWLSDPAAALALGPRLAPGAHPRRPAWARAGWTRAAASRR